MESVINRINDLLNKRGVKQKSLAAVLGITQAGVSKIFTGKNSLSVEYFYKMCVFLEISADWILQLDKESEEINIPKDPMFYFKSNVNHLTGNGNISQKVEGEKGELQAEIIALKQLLSAQEKLITSMESDIKTKQSLINILSTQK
jgi:transcriptional regulator with XRE-family HTH domain